MSYVSENMTQEEALQFSLEHAYRALEAMADGTAEVIRKEDGTISEIRFPSDPVSGCTDAICWPDD